MIRKKTTFNLDSSGFQNEMGEWLQTALGQELLARESALLDEYLPTRFGYHFMQFGFTDHTFFENSRIGHKFSLSADTGTSDHDLIASTQSLPVKSETVDLVLLHHALDFSSHQHQLLREVSRVLISGGSVIIFGFNPLSCWGTRQKLPWHKKQPWQAKLLSTRRISDWLTLLDFQIEQIRYGVYALPVNSEKVIRYSGFMEPVASRLNWPSGGIYMICAKKQAIPVNPIKTQWSRFAHSPVNIPITENITRSKHDQSHGMDGNN